MPSIICAPAACSLQDLSLKLAAGSLPIGTLPWRHSPSLPFSLSMSSGAMRYTEAVASMLVFSVYHSHYKK